MKQRTLLIVDDEPLILKAILRVLRNDRYVIFTAADADEGLKILEDRKVELVVSDQNMPGMPGVDFLQKVKADHPNTLTIMLTGQADIDVAMRAMNDAGVYKFILKPWDDSDFKLTIRHALESMDLMREHEALKEDVRS
jgi:DNA-binding NtrC family response regulator